MGFNLGCEGIYTFEMMNTILNYYSNTRHETLTKILYQAAPELKIKYPNGISPKFVNDNKYLETLYVQECIKYNYHIITQKDFKLNNDDIVKVVNKKDSIIDENKINSRSILSKDNYRIIGQQGNIYSLLNENKDKIIYRPRYEIKLLK